MPPSSTDLRAAADRLRDAAAADRPHEPTQYFAIGRLGSGLQTDPELSAFGLALAGLARQIAETNEDEAIPIKALPFWRSVATTLADALDEAAASDVNGALRRLGDCVALLSPPERRH